MKKVNRIKVWEKYDKHCAYCGRKIEYKEMQIDHLVPQSLAHFYSNKRMKDYIGGKGDNIDSFENLMPACRRCNHYKRAYRIEAFRELVKTLHERVRKQYIAKVAIDYGIIQICPWDGRFYFEKMRENA